MGRPPKKTKNTDELTNNTKESYCVLETKDGARIMNIETANAYVNSSTKRNGSSATLHYAGTFQDAEKLMKDLETKEAKKKCTFILKKKSEMHSGRACNT
jgi:hypothetical protein